MFAIDCRIVDVFDRAERSRVMRAVHSRGNRSTEIVLADAFRTFRVTGWRRHAGSNLVRPSRTANYHHHYRYPNPARADLPVLRRQLDEVRREKRDVEDQLKQHNVK